MIKKLGIRKIAVAFIIAVFTISGIGVSIFVTRFANTLQDSILFSTGDVRKIPRKLITNLLAQISVPQPAVDAATICSYTPPDNQEYKGEFITDGTKVWAEPGGDFSVSIYIKNTGNAAWFGDFSGCPGVSYMRLGTARDRDRDSVFYNPADPVWLTSNRIAMIELRVDPGEIGTFSFTAKAPQVEDIFKEYFQPVVEGKTWLDSKDETTHIDVYVGENDQENEKRLFYLAKSGQASALDLSKPAVIDVDISQQKLRMKFGDTVVREYAVSTGTFKTPTPFGRFKILNKQELRIAGKWPHYRMPLWQGFTKWGHGLHSLPYLANDRGVFWNEALDHIGQRVSHGCIRMLPEDAQDLYSLTEVGMEVVIHG